MKAIGWLYDTEFEFVFKNIGKDLWEDLRQEVAYIVLQYDRKKISELDMKQIDKKLSEYVGGPIDKLLPSEKREILEKAIMKDRSVIDLIKKSRERIAEIKRKEDLMPKQRDIYPK